MTTTTAAADAPVVFILPRVARVALAKLTDRLARKRNSMSEFAVAAVQALLADSDRVELTYMQATALMSQTYAECARVELARSRGRMTDRQQFLSKVIDQTGAQFQTSGWRRTHDTATDAPRA